MQRDALYWRRARSNPPPGCLWRLWRSASTLTQPFRPDGNVLCWCCWKSMCMPPNGKHWGADMLPILMVDREAYDPVEAIMASTILFQWFINSQHSHGCKWYVVIVTRILTNILTYSVLLLSDCGLLLEVGLFIAGIMWPLSSHVLRMKLRHNSCDNTRTPHQHRP